MKEYNCSVCGIKITKSSKTGKCLKCSHIGQVPWMTGKKHTDETRKRISNRNKEAYSENPELGKQISERSRGKPTWASTHKEEMRAINLGNTYCLGHKLTDEHKKNISEANKGKVVSDEVKEIISNASKLQWQNDRDKILTPLLKFNHTKKGKKNPHKVAWSEESRKRGSLAGIKRFTDPEQRYKARMATIADLKKKNMLLGKPGARNFNLNACKFIDKLNMEKGYNLQHALNGGEMELYGYYVDGYDKERNIIFEYDEPRHYNVDRTLKKKDMQRQVDLLTEIKPLLFLRYDERDNRLYDCKIQSEIGVM